MGAKIALLVDFIAWLANKWDGAGIEVLLFISLLNNPIRKREPVCITAI